jgi:RNA polymerase subunit RPABC4/transcription elongation factor Spt4
MPSDEFICPVCGATVPTKARACPECGSDEKTGWSDRTIYDGTGIEDPDEFDYENWKRRELGGVSRKSVIKWVWLLVAVLLFILFLWMFVLRRIMEVL